jgi:serine/threonine protein kinase/formylglycine-generating enzyme required for sulfatase activity
MPRSRFAPDSESSMGLTQNDQQLVRYLLDNQIVRSEMIVQLTLQASSQNINMLQAVQHSGLVSREQLAPFFANSTFCPPTVLNKLNDNEAPTVISHESGRLAASLQSQPGAAEALASIPRANSRFGSYDLLNVIGKGGMGMVFRARHIELQRFCAIKVLTARQNHVKESHLRFLSEAKTIAQLDQHENIVRIFNAGEVGQTPYISMELIEGQSLKEYCQSTQISVEQALRFTTQIADALHYVHQNGIIHRDVKPANILITEDGQAKLTDFGVAKNLPQSQELTMTGAVIGTLSYMAPEQAEDSKGIDWRADIYSLGAVLYFMLCGQAPHTGASSANVIASLMTRNPVPPSQLNPEVSAELEKLVLTALHRDRSKRFASAKDFQRALVDFLKQKEGPQAKIEKVRPAKKPLKRLRKKARKRFPGLALSLAFCFVIGVMGIYSLSKKPEDNGAAVKKIEAATKVIKPQLTNLNIKDKQWLRTKILELSGQFKNADKSDIYLRSARQLIQLKFDALGRFKHTVTLKEGRQELLFQWKTGESFDTLSQRQVTVDSIKPVLSFPGGDSVEHEDKRFTLLGTVNEANLKNLTINNQTVEPNNDSFRQPVLLKPGKNRFTVRATDNAGNVSDKTITVNWIKAQLRLLLEGPKKILTNKKMWTFKGRLSPGDATLTVNKAPLKTSAGQFELTAPLEEGPNTFVFDAQRQNKGDSQTAHITADFTPPNFEIESPKQGALLSDNKVLLQLRNEEELAELVLVNTKNQHPTTQTNFKKNGQMLFALTDGHYKFNLTARDEAGNQSQADLAFTVDTTAPKIDYSVNWAKSSKLYIALEVLVKDLSKVVSFTVRGKRITLKENGPTQIKLRRAYFDSGVKITAKDQLGHVQTIVATLPLDLLNDRIKWAAAGRNNEGRKAQDLEIASIAKRVSKTLEMLKVGVFECGGERHRIAVFRHKKTGIQLNLLPGGSFLMGSKDKELAITGASPPCKVTLKPFFMGRFELKQSEWKRFDQSIVLSNPGPDLPMSNISWLMIKDWLKKAGGELRMPSESEWEYACRAGTTSAYFWGDRFDPSYVWCGENSAGSYKSGAIHEKSGKWNAFGLVEILGNVWEWIEDNASPGYDEQPPPNDGSPYILPVDNGHMDRGGYYGSDENQLKQGYRDSTQKDKVSIQLGVRLSMSIPDK